MTKIGEGSRRRGRCSLHYYFFLDGIPQVVQPTMDVNGEADLGVEMSLS